MNSETHKSPEGTEPIYNVVEDDKPGRFKVVDETGRTIVACSGRPNAEHYATLLEQAYARGLRAGRRSSRSRDD